MAGASVGDVLRALEDLRRGSEYGATRTSVVNLVVVAASSSDVELACDAIAGLGGRHPGRVIVLAPGDAAGIDASVSLLGGEVEGARVWSEQVRLTVGGPLWSHLDSLIEPLTLPDLPVVVWCVSSLPEPGDPLAAAADVLLVDSKLLGYVRAFAGVAELARRNVVVDLSWSRLRPWREVLASVYPPGVMARHAELRGKEGPRHLMAGWVASRLGLPRSAFSLAADRHVSLRLTGDGFECWVTREEGARVVRAGASVEGGPTWSEVLSLPDSSLSWSLAAALTHLERDRVWEQAVRGSLVFAAPSGD